MRLPAVAVNPGETGAGRPAASDRGLRDTWSMTFGARDLGSGPYPAVSTMLATIGQTSWAPRQIISSDT